MTDERRASIQSMAARRKAVETQRNIDYDRALLRKNIVEVLLRIGVPLALLAYIIIGCIISGVL